MEKALEQFAKDFSDAGLRIDSDAAEARRSGVLRGGGWTVQYCFGEDERGPYLDYYSAHRMTDDDHVRLYADGTRVMLEAFQVGHVVSADPALTARFKRQMQLHNAAVVADLAAKGFGDASTNMYLMSSDAAKADPLCEKDLDFALGRAIENNDPVAAWLLAQTRYGDTPARVVFVRSDHPWTATDVPVTSPETGETTLRRMEGETDVLAVYETEQGLRIGVHIENKAPRGTFRELQAERYRARAQQWVGSAKYGNYTEWLTVLIAPEEVVRQAPDQAGRFDLVLTLADVGRFVTAYALAHR